MPRSYQVRPGIHGPVASDTTRTGQTKVDSNAESQLAADPNSNDPAGQHQVKATFSLSDATA